MKCSLGISNFLEEISDSQQAFAVWLRKLKQGLCINLDGWEGKENGREDQKGGNICIPMSDSC